MRWPTHLVVGALVVEAVVRSAHPGAELVAGAALAASAGSVAPDLDHLGAWVKADFSGSNIGHRTFTHGLLGLAGASWLGRLLHLPAPVLLAWVAAWGAHLLADLLTPEGCPLLWPLRHRTSLGICRTGGWLETWALRPALGALALVVAVKLVRGAI